MMGEDVENNGVKDLGGGTDWKARASDHNGWKAGCMMGWSWWQPILKKKKKMIIM